ncbi:MAG TPA: DUF960 family protein [Pseudogracilibacillus sp.]|nr:DUF960 family protein [Pseudogracilibacillus sp.]
MFNDKNKRYMTKTIDETVHAEIQMILWNLINEQRNEEKELDYLQVFELKMTDGRQRIVHRQEVPERKREWVYTLQYTTPIDQTIWCIDSEEYQMMLLPNEY